MRRMQNAMRSDRTTCAEACRLVVSVKASVCFAFTSAARFFAGLRFYFGNAILIHI